MSNGTSWILNFFTEQLKKNPGFSVNRYQIKYIGPDKKLVDKTQFIYPNSIVLIDKYFRDCPKCKKELIIEISAKEGFYYSCLHCDYRKSFEKHPGEE